MDSDFFNKLILNYRLLFIVFLSVIFSVLTVNGDFYRRLFPEDSDVSDFTSATVPFKDRFSQISKFIGYFILFVLVYVAVVIIILFIYCYVRENDGPNQMNNALVNFIPLVWDNEGQTAKSFYMWLIVALMFTYIFFILYSQMHKVFLQELLFPSTFRRIKEGEEAQLDGEEPTPQPRIFMWYYAVLVLMVLCFGILLTFINDDIFNIIVVLMTLVVLFTVMIAIIGFILKKRMEVAIIMIVVFWLIIYIYELVGEYKTTTI